MHRRAGDQSGQLPAADVAADLARRDQIDSSRAASPLMVADGAVVIDTTGRTIDEVVAAVVDLVTGTSP